MSSPPLETTGPKKEWSGREYVCLGGLLLLLPGLLRVIGLDAFPGVMADEGLWTNSTKNFVLFGDWFMDGRTHVLLSPVFHALSAFAFWILGPSIGSARLVGAILGTLSVPLLFLLVRRSTGRIDLAVVTSVIFGFSAIYAFASRQAMIEFPQVALSLLAAVLVARKDYAGAVLGGLAFAGAILTKINILFLGPILVLFLLPEKDWGGALRNRRFWKLAITYGGVALGVSAVTYFLLFLWEPENFRAAYLFELEGAHFEPLSNPIIRIGRFGLDPAYSARSIIELIRDAPFQFVFCAMGAAVALVNRSRVPPAFWVWLMVGTGLPLVQNYQPLRYFYLAAPAYAFFAGLLIVQFKHNAPAGRWFNLNRVQIALVGLYTAFNLAYLSMNAVANRDIRLQTVREWVTENLPSDARIVSAGYFATDLPNRTYAHYHLGADSIDELISNLEAYDIDFVIWDRGEWAPHMRGDLALHYEIVMEWDFGAVFEASERYRLRDPSSANGATAMTPVR